MTTTPDEKRTINMAAANVANVIGRLLDQISNETGLDLQYALTVYDRTSDHGTAVITIDLDVLRSLFQETIDKAEQHMAFSRATHAPSGVLN